MRKFKILTLAVLCLFILSTSAFPDTTTEVRFQGGGIISDAFNFKYIWGTYGFNFDIYFTNLIFISPELYIVMTDFSFKNMSLAPGFTANIQSGDIFFGFGPVKWFSIGPGSNTRGVQLKLHTGIRTENVVVTLFGIMSADSLFKNMDIGLTLGFTI